MSKTKTRKNGWDIRERTDPRTGEVRPMAIRYQNGDEVEKHWLDQDRPGQTEWGAVVDANRDAKIVLRKEELNKKYWRRYKSQTDYPGEDTRLDKDSPSYREKLEKYRSKRYIAVSVQCRAVTQNGERCENLTNDTDGFCHLHKPVPVADSISVRCRGRNRDGSRCQNLTNDPDGFCSIHEKQK